MRELKHVVAVLLLTIGPGIASARGLVGGKTIHHGARVLATDDGTVPGVNPRLLPFVKVMDNDIGGGARADPAPAFHPADGDRDHSEEWWRRQEEERQRACAERALSEQREREAQERAEKAEREALDRAKQWEAEERARSDREERARRERIADAERAHRERSYWQIVSDGIDKGMQRVEPGADGAAWADTVRTIYEMIDQKR